MATFEIGTVKFESKREYILHLAAINNKGRLAYALKDKIAKAELAFHAAKAVMDGLKGEREALLKQVADMHTALGREYDPADEEQYYEDDFW